MHTRDPFVHQHAEGEHVGGRTGRAAFNLFGCHVGRRPGERSRRSRRRHGAGAAVTRLDAGQTEVENLQAAVAHAHDVFRLQVAMRDAFRMRARQRGRQFTAG